MDDFSHYDQDGSSRMVDISAKGVSSRYARAEGFVLMGVTTLGLIRDKLLPKGNVFEVAKIAGILAAKKTSDLIPLCHPLQLNYVDVVITLEEDKGRLRIESEIRLDGKTGAEMEALTAVSTAALTVYDMCKAVDKGMRIEGITLTEKRGGKSDFISK